MVESGMNKLAVIALVSQHIFIEYAKDPSSKLNSLEIQTLEMDSVANCQGQILSIEAIDSALADLFYLGYVSKGSGEKYFYDLTGRALQLSG